MKLQEDKGCLPQDAVSHPGDNPWANLKSISHRCHPILVAFVWELTKETIDLPLGCLQGGRTLRGIHRMSFEHFIPTCTHLFHQALGSFVCAGLGSVLGFSFCLEIASRFCLKLASRFRGVSK